MATAWDITFFPDGLDSRNKCRLYIVILFKTPMYIQSFVNIIITLLNWRCVNVTM